MRLARGKRVRVTTYVPQNVHAELVRIAKQENASLSETAAKKLTFATGQYVV